jgi:hypothetical protein
MDLRVRRSEYSRWSLYVYRETPCLEWAPAYMYREARYEEMGLYLDWRNKHIWWRFLGVLATQPFPQLTRPPMHVSCRCLIRRL